MRENDYPITDEPVEDAPPLEVLETMLADGYCKATDGCTVEPDGYCKHNCPSWLIQLGMI